MLSSVFKRAFDIVASLLLLILTLPLDPAHRDRDQARIARARPSIASAASGSTTRAFDILKLRSMRQDAEVAGQGGVGSRRTIRAITRIGRFIRKVRIDELPQTWTVLKGEMSFVGPRPERPQFVDELEQQLPYLCRAAHGEAGHHRLGADQLSRMARRSRMPGTSWNTTCITRRTIRRSSTC